MSYIEQYFGKQPQDLTYQDITDFFSVEREESDKIEFKSYMPKGDEKAKETALIKTTCALLNSSGGIIIWGAPQGKTVEGKKEKVFQGELSPVTRIIEKDYFINRISDLITPTPVGVSFIRLEQNGAYVYLIEVMQSDYSPHQFDNTYYMRLDGQNKIAPHHYVEALFKKTTYPRLKGFIKLNLAHQNNGITTITIRGFIFNLSTLQHEYKLFYRVLTTGGNFHLHNVPNGRRTSQEISMTLPETLYYNQPSTFRENLNFDFTQYQGNSFSFDVIFVFGGEKSPLLQSYYKFKLDIPSGFIQEVDKKENAYLFDYSGNLGLSEDEAIKRVIDNF